MPSFSSKSLQRLETCHIDLQTLFEEVVRRYDCTILEGQRSKERQAELVEQGFSKTQNSKHLLTPSMAVDVIPYPFKSSDWKNMKRFYHFAGYVQATFQQLQDLGTIDQTYRLVSGLDWDGDNDLDDQSFMDGPHFELRAK